MLRVSFVLLFGLLLTFSHDASANVTAAARAFSEGQAAQLEGNYELAAKRYELAHSLVPSKEALRAAARMRLLAEHYASAATHAESLQQQFPDDEASMTLANDILNEVQDKLTRYEVACSTECTLSVDGRALFVTPTQEHVFYLEPGRLSLEASFANGETASRIVTGKAGESIRFELEEPDPEATKSSAPVPPPPPAQEGTPPPQRVEDAPPSESGGLPVFLPVTAGIATIAAASVATWAAVDTQKQHDAYAEDPTEEGWNDGVERQRLTNILWGTTAVLGGATIVLALFTDWDGEERVAFVPSADPDGASLTMTGRF